MMRVCKSLSITMSFDEAYELYKVVGHVSPDDYRAKYGLTHDGVLLMRALCGALPTEDNEEGE